MINLVHRLQYLAFISRYWNMEFSDSVYATLKGMEKVSFGEIFDDLGKEESEKKELSPVDENLLEQSKDSFKSESLVKTIGVT